LYPHATTRLFHPLKPPCASNRISFFGQCVAAASGALAGRLPQAEKAMARVRQLNPALRISNLKDFLPFGRQEDFDRWAEGLRKAGLPE
jgi:adenylate cyclase